MYIILKVMVKLKGLIRVLKPICVVLFILVHLNGLNGWHWLSFGIIPIFTLLSTNPHLKCSMDFHLVSWVWLSLWLLQCLIFLTGLKNELMHQLVRQHLLCAQARMKRQGDFYYSFYPLSLDK